MAGRFETKEIGKYEKSSKHIMTIDLFDVQNPYLEIRAAEIHFNVIEVNKTSPTFISPLDLT